MIPLFPRNRLTYNDIVEHDMEQSSNTVLKPGGKFRGNNDIVLTTIDVSSPLVIPSSSKFSENFFFFTIECDIAYSDSWFFLSEEFTDTRAIAAHSPPVHVTIINTANNCSESVINGSNSQISIYNRLKRLIPDHQRFIHIVEDHLDMSNLSAPSNAIFSWLSSWGSNNKPTLEILRISQSKNSSNTTHMDDPLSLRNNILKTTNLQSKLDASGTAGWGGNSLLGATTDDACFGQKDVAGVCGMLVLLDTYACDSSDIPMSFKGGLIALVPRGICSFTDKAKNVQLAGYKAVVIFNVQFVGKITMGGDSSSVTIPVVMIDYVPALRLLDLVDTVGQYEAGNASYEVLVRLYSRTAPVPIACINRVGEVLEMGQRWVNVSDVVLAQARYNDYYYDLQIKLVSMQSSHQVVSIAEQVAYWGAACVDIPEELGAHGSNFSFQTTAYTSMHMYLETRCVDGWDASCPQWDQLLSVYACAVNVSNVFECSENSPEVELLRSVTAYSRPHAGLVDVSPLLFMLSAIRSKTFHLNKIRFRLSGSSRFLFTMRLYLKPLIGPNQPSDYTQSIPMSGHRLWSNNDALTSTYNQRQRSYSLPLPSYAQTVGVFGYITGHGWGKDLANCAEFCEQSHNFRLGIGLGSSEASQSLLLSASFVDAGTDLGCERRVSSGVTANQYGTWYFGRGGWCPGLVVPPLSWSILLPSNGTRAEVTHSHNSFGSVAYNENGSLSVGRDSSRNITMSYFALVNGVSYDPIHDPDAPSNDGFDALIFRNMWFVAYASVPTTPKCVALIDVETSLLSVSWSSTAHTVPVSWFVVRILHCPADYFAVNTSGCHLVMEKMETDEAEVDRANMTSLTYNLSSSTSTSMYANSSGRYLVRVYRANGVGAGPPCFIFPTSVGDASFSPVTTHQFRVPPLLIIIVVSAGIVFLMLLGIFVRYFSRNGRLPQFLAVGAVDNVELGVSGGAESPAAHHRITSTETSESADPTSPGANKEAVSISWVSGAFFTNPMQSRVQEEDDYEETLETLHPKL